MFRFLLQKNIQKKGFTLVEMMVAIAVFSIVMVVATSALLNVIDANHKAQAIKTSINNVNFALESISKDMRVGTEYGCGDDNPPTGDCISDGGNIIKYISNKAVMEDGSLGYIYYRYIKPNISVTPNVPGRIEQCIEKEDNLCGYDTGTYFSITSEDVNIINMRFYVTGTGDSNVPKTQPRVVITLTGEAGTKEKIKTTFDLQTSVSQRARILPN